MDLETEDARERGRLVLKQDLKFMRKAFLISEAEIIAKKDMEINALREELIRTQTELRKLQKKVSKIA